MKWLIAIGTIAALLLAIWKRFFTASATVRRLKKERNEILEKLEAAVASGDTNLHNKLLVELKRVRREINRLSK